MSRPLLLSIVVACAGLAQAGEAKPPTAAGFTVHKLSDASVTNAPTCLAARPDGTGVAVAEDPHNVRNKQSGNGRIHLLVDIDNDGKPEKRTVFADKLNSARGMCWVGDALYVVNCPFLTVLRDSDGDGVAEQKEQLVTGLGETPEQRPPDHSINGIHLAADGWLYIAVGDQGTLGKAVSAKDGSEAYLGGGGVIRLRPDGSELQTVVEGCRNIYDLGISPTLDAFARENTNDGGGWNVRILHLPNGSQMGYPHLYKNFAEEALAPITDLGGGSGCGGVWADDPLLPATAQGFLSCDWAKNSLYRMTFTPAGAGFTTAQQEVIKCPHITDADVDGVGRVYVAEWGAHSFGLAKAPHGAVWRLDAAGAKPGSFPDPAKLDDAALARAIAGPGQVLRCQAQQAAVKRGATPALIAALDAAVKAKGEIAGRVAALFALARIEGAAATPRLVGYAGDAALREFALRALADGKALAAKAPIEPFTAGLKDADARVRLQAAIGLGALGRAESAPALVAALTDADATVRHAARRAVQRIGDPAAALAAAKTPGPAGEAALLALRRMHAPATVDGLIALAQSASEPAHRVAVLTTLAILAHREQVPRKRWWGIKPYHQGPYYDAVAWEATDRIKAALEAEAKRVPADAAQIAELLARYRPGWEPPKTAPKK